MTNDDTPADLEASPTPEPAFTVGLDPLLRKGDETVIETVACRLVNDSRDPMDETTTSNATSTPTLVSIEIAIAVTDLHGRYLFTNRCWDAMCPQSPPGPSPDRPGARCTIDDHHPELLPDSWRTTWAKAAKGEGDDRVVDEEVLLAGGERRFIRWTTAPWIDDRTQTRGVLIALIDATACLTCFNRLTLTDSRFQTFANAAFDVVFCMSPDWSETRFVHGRKFLLDSFGPAADWMTTYLPVTARPQFRNMIADAITHERNFEVETEVIRTGGSSGWAQTRAAPIRDADGRIVEWFGAAMDITARKRAELALRDREARLDAILSTAADTIVTVGTEGMLRTVNPAAERAFGHASSAMVGRHISLLIPDLDPAGLLEILTRHDTETPDAPITTELRGRRRDGSIFPVEVKISRVDHGGLHVAIIRDLTDQRRAEGRLRDSERLSAIGTLAAGLGHDMNTILLPIRARLDAIREIGASTEVQGQFGEIQRGIDYLQNLADGLHQLSRDPGSDAESSLRPNPVELGTWWHHTGPLLRRAIPASVRFEADFAEALPPVLVPQHSLTQAILNLLVNAGKAVSPDGSITIRARRIDEEFVSISVIDDGVGMSEKVRRHATDPFFTTRPRGLGTGLGLPLARRVATQAGGCLEIESELGRGTAVTITLPALIDDDNDLVHVHPIASIAIEDARLASLTAGVLEAEGFTVVDLLDLPVDGIHRADLFLVDAAHLPLTIGGAGQDPVSPPTILLGAVRPDQSCPPDVQVVPSGGSFEHLRTALQAAIERTIA